MVDGNGSELSYCMILGEAATQFNQSNWLYHLDNNAGL